MRLTYLVAYWLYSLWDLDMLPFLIRATYAYIMGAIYGNTLYDQIVMYAYFSLGSHIRFTLLMGAIYAHFTLSELYIYA